MQNRFSNASTPSRGPLSTLQRTAVALIGSSALLWGQPAVAQVNVTTYHYDTSATGQNLNEVTLSPTNVNSTQFGKLFSYPVDGFVYTQPLYLSGVATSSGSHNVVYIATEHDSVYAFDADNSDAASGGGLLWQRSFINLGAGIRPVPTLDLYPASIPDIRPEIGISGTPVIDYDPASGTGTLYVVVKTREDRGDGTHYVQKLHALDVGTGADKIVAGGRLIGDTTAGGVHDPANPCVPGTGDGSLAGQVCFHARRENNRMALALLNGVVWVPFASHGDQGPYHGWVLGYREADLGLMAKLNDTPNGGLGGFWEGGGVPVFDSDNNMYLAAGNGTFRTDPDGTQNYGQGVLKISTTPDGTGRLQVLDFFTSFEQATTNQFDLDQGSGGILGMTTGFIAQTGKRGKIFLLDTLNMGGYRHGAACDQEPVLETCDAPVQFTSNGTISGGSYGTPAFFSDGFNPFLYYGGNGDTIKQFGISDSGLITLPPISQSADNFGFTGVTPTISASGGSNPILWGLNVNGYGLPARPNPSPMILFAYDAYDLGNLLYSSAMTGRRDQMGDGVKFNTPTVANGKVYVGTQGTCQETDTQASCGTLEVFGLFPEAVALPAAPSSLSATAGPPFPAPTSITLAWTNNASDATGVVIERSLNGTDFTPLTQVGRTQTSYIDTFPSVQASTKYYYRVKATNQIGDSTASSIASATTHIGGPALTVDDIFDMEVALKWTATANNHYIVERSSDGVSFMTVGTVPAGTTTFTDPVPAFGMFFYRVTAFNSDGDHATSNTISGTVGPVSVAHGGGFASHGDLTANANTTRPIFFGSVIQLTDGMNSEAGTVFTNTPLGIRKFTTSFTIQQSGIADGMAFIIQSNSPMSLGASGGGLGYQGIQNSVAIKFDLFNHGHGGYSTGQYVDGHTPDVPGSGEADISLVGTPINLTSGHPIRVDLSYDIATQKLIEILTDTVTGGSLTIDDYPPINIPGHVGADTAFVGFGAGTGGLPSTNVVQKWTFTEDEAGLPPRKPSNLHVSNIQAVDATHFNISLGWKGNNAYTAMGYRLERSTNGTTFIQIAELPVSQTNYTDPNLVAPGSYFYRVHSFAGSLNSDTTPVVCAPLGLGGGIDHSSGFACHGDLAQTGNASYAGTPPNPVFARLTDGGGGEASSIFTVNRFDIRSFHTSFTLRIHDPANADGMCFVIQGNDPNQLGGSGGGLGYGSDTRGGPRGIRNSICVKFDIFDNQGEGANTTGLFGDGRSPTLPERDSGDVLVDLQPTPINLHSQDVFQVDLTYDGTTLIEKITDLNTTNSFTVPGYLVNIPAMVGGNTAFLGFTGGTGGLTATQDVQIWMFRNP